MPLDTGSLLLDYLDDRKEILRTLLTDISYLSGDQSEGEMPLEGELVLAVDWAEVYAYITVSVLPSNETIAKLPTRPGLVEGAHQAALSFLFNHFHGRLLMLPPYVAEMRNFIDRIKSEIASLESKQEDATVRFSNQCLSESASALLKQLEDWAKRQRDSSAISFDCLQDFFSEDQTIEVLDLIRNEFSQIYFLAKIGNVNALRSLRNLISGGTDGAKKLITLSDLNPQLANKVRSATPSASKWVAELGRVNPRKNSSALKIDGAALGYLEMLNPMLFQLGQQVLFISRSQDIRTVMNRHRGTFGCLLDQYWSESEDHPTLFRPWLFYLELGGVWGGRTKEAMEESLWHQFHRVRATLLQLTLGKKPWRDNLREVEGNLVNIHSFYSATNSKLLADEPIKPLDDGSFKNRLVALFVEYVTSPDKFAQRWKELGSNIEQELKILDVSIQLDFSSRVVDGNARDGMRGILKTIVEALGPDWGSTGFLSDHARALFKKAMHHLTMREGITQDLEDIRHLIRRFVKDHGTEASDRLGREGLCLVAVWSYLCRSWDGSKTFLAQLLKEESGGLDSFQWMIANLVIADCCLHESNAALRPADEILDKIIDRYSHTPQCSRPLRLGLLVSRLALNLDATEGLGEQRNSFPVSWQAEDKLALQIALQQIEEFFSEQDLHSDIPETLLMYAANMTVYGCARLIDREHSPNDLFHMRTFSILLDMLESRIEVNATAATLDTLGYYYLKLTFWSREHSDADKAREYLRRGLSVPDCLEPVRNALEEHLRLHKDLIAVI